MCYKFPCSQVFLDSRVVSLIEKKHHKETFTVLMYILDRNAFYCEKQNIC